MRTAQATLPDLFFPSMPVWVALPVDGVSSDSNIRTFNSTWQSWHQKVGMEQRQTSRMSAMSTKPSALQICKNEAPLLNVPYKAQEKSLEELENGGDFQKESQGRNGGRVI